MNRIDRILQTAALPDMPVEALPEDRQAGILSGTMQLVRQETKKHSRKRVIRIMIAAAAAIAVLCGAAAVLHYASVSDAETTYHAEGASIRPDGTLEPFSYDFSRDAIIRVDTEGRTSGTYCGVQFGWTPTALIPDHRHDDRCRQHQPRGNTRSKERSCFFHHAGKLRDFAICRAITGSITDQAANQYTCDRKK